MANILIADDSIVMRKNLKSILTRSGHNVVAEAVNGQQAYTLYNKGEIDIVTLDITMPVLDGIGALKKILEKDPNAKVIIISALDQKRMVFEALESGAKYYIIKPVTEDKIVNALNKVLLSDNESTVNTSRSELSNEIPENAKANLNGAKNAEVVSEDTTSIPFMIENINGTFKITINSSLDSTNITPLLSALQGFLFIKPLKVSFIFPDSCHLEGRVLDILVEMSKKIISSGGEFNAIGQQNMVDKFTY